MDVSFSLPGIKEKYYCPKINAYQLEGVLGQYEGFLGFVQSEGFDPEKIDNVTAIAMFAKYKLDRRFVAWLIAPVGEEFTDGTNGTKDTHTENVEALKYMPIEFIIDAHENGDFKPGMVLANFFTSNANLEKLFDGLISSWITAIVSQTASSLGVTPIKTQLSEIG
jgi:hypothetical protein